MPFSVRGHSKPAQWLQGGFCFLAKGTDAAGTGSSRFPWPELRQGSELRASVGVTQKPAVLLSLG